MCCCKNNMSNKYGGSMYGKKMKKPVKRKAMKKPVIKRKMSGRRK